ncbi:LAMTOR1 isoform 2 [Pan troglodytes]|uniref:Late endosomal/lysosomal adaptor, MAPK and MTOR activator 1 n=3 Tax=Hominidae TaxID=9604 RepID=F5H267_HUMAN|nr:late endosomal/lysosomal adaptor, MAPK and MTOR activator 1 [Homo sapiens]KAI4072934.1 late endosomal/lysosomal adaptor, MAPK and MTOR activator 1 [Homo sapiens]PNI89591.1 LAMTOR1 isoform 2 [Pan troglodytes]PNJ51574.1 LAMTOR1 isoform 2 [Pongo abelii]
MGCCWTLAAPLPKLSMEPSPTTTACLPLALMSRPCSLPSLPRQPATSLMCLLQTHRAWSSMSTWTVPGSTAPAWLC